MSIKGRNKMVRNEDFTYSGQTRSNDALTTPKKFFFPTLGITVEADSLKEATVKVKQLINKEN